MITEDYVNFETAKLLKEKGFDEHCPLWYNLNKPLEGPFFYKELGWYGHNSYSYVGRNIISAPTIQRTIKWLREVHNCHIYVQALMTTDGLQGYCPFYTKVGDIFMWQNVLGDDYATTQTYEEACEIAIKYCLENLI